MPQIQDAIIYSDTGAESMTEGKRSFAGRILIPPPTGDYDVKIITSSGEEIKAAWPGWDRAMFINSSNRGEKLESYQHRKYLWKQAVSKIDPSQEYQIDVLTSIYVEPNSINDEILRVMRNGYVVIDASICRVHKVPMKRHIEDSYSAEEYPESFFRQQKEEFPNDGNEYLGCGSGPSFPTWKCPECSRRYDTWIKKHGIRE